MCGEPRVAAECTCTEREVGRCSRPTVRPADERLADRDPRLRLAGLAGTVRRVGGPDHDPMPAGRDRPTGQDRPRRGRRTRRTGQAPILWASSRSAHGPRTPTGRQKPSRSPRASSVSPVCDGVDERVVLPGLRAPGDRA